MRDALLPTMKGLITNDLLRHSDMDVRLSVTSCISEITRITAPDSPYDDELMKVLIVILEQFSYLHQHGILYSSTMQMKFLEYCVCC